VTEARRKSETAWASDSLHALRPVLDAGTLQVCLVGDDWDRRTLQALVAWILYDNKRISSP
jgi:hypothetical protein